MKQNAFSDLGHERRLLGFILFAIAILTSMLIVATGVSDTLVRTTHAGVSSTITVMPVNCGMDAKTYMELPVAARYQLESDGLCRWASNAQSIR